MKIPRRFQLLGRTVEVVENPQLMQDRNWAGAAVYESDRIELLPPSASYVVSDGKYEQTFCHEFAHFLLYHAGGAINHALDDKGEIHQREDFVDLLGSLIHQALNTMEYE